MSASRARSAIPLVDLAALHRQTAKEVEAAVRRVLASGSYILGAQVRAFEAALAAQSGCLHGVGVNSGTDAIELALRACRIGPGDDVLVPAMTFMSTALSVTAVGARPVIVDIEEKSYGIDPEDAARRCTSATKAIIPVHLYGQACDLDGVLRLARRRRLAVIEDCAQAAGASYRGRPVGSFGDAGCFSFYPTKNLGAAGDGGAVVTRSAEIARRVRLLRNYGTEDKVTFTEFGRNSRLDELQAAILLVKLKHLASWNAARHLRAGWYRDAFADARIPGIRLPQELPRRSHIYHVYAVRVPDRDRVSRELEARGIQTIVHYARPIHLDSIYTGQPLRAGDLPAAEALAREVISLPMHPFLTRTEIRTVVAAIAQTLR